MSMSCYLVPPATYSLAIFAAASLVQDNWERRLGTAKAGYISGISLRV